MRHSLVISLALLFLILLVIFLSIQVKAVSGIYYHNGTIYVNGNFTTGNLNVLPTQAFEQKNQTCYIKEPIDILPNSSFTLSNSSCKNVKMYPDTYLRVSGEIYFRDVNVTSYNPTTGKPVKLTRDEYYLSRPYIYTEIPVKYFYAVDSEFSYMGYYKENLNGSRWGIGLYDIAGPHGAYFYNVSIHNNYFGIYTHNVTGLVVENSKIYNDLEYGLDFHDGSNGFIIYGNDVYGNGHHGIIFSKGCYNNTIANNFVYNNSGLSFTKGVVKSYGINGIMLHHFSDDNEVIDNILLGNDVGIYLEQSSGNLIEGNQVESSLQNGIYLSSSDNNTFLNNNVSQSNLTSIYSYYSYNNSYSENYFSNGSYFKVGINGTNYTRRLNSTTIPEKFVISKPQTNKSENSTKSSSTGIPGLSFNSTQTKLIFAGVLVSIFLLVLAVEFLRSFRRKNAN